LTFPQMAPFLYRRGRRAFLLAGALAGASQLRSHVTGPGTSAAEQNYLQLAAVPGLFKASEPRTPAIGFVAAAGAVAIASAAAGGGGGGRQSEAPKDAGSSLGTSVLNLSKNIIGAGMLSLPYAMKGAGVVPFLLGILAMGCLNAYTFFLLGWCCQATGATSFGELWSKAFGRGSAWLADVSVMMNNSLACLAYCVLIGDFLSKALAGLLPSTPWLHDRGTDLVLVAVLVLVPLSLLRDLAPLRFGSVAGLGATLYVFLLLVKDCTQDADLGSAGAVVRNLAPARIDFFQSLALFSSAFMAHYNSPKFYSQLQDPTLPRFATLVGGAFGLPLIVFILFGFCGFAIFGFSVEGNVLKNYGGGPQVMLAWLSMAFSVAFTYPLVFSTLRESSASLLSSLGVLKDASSDSFRIPFTLGAVALTVLGGTVFSNVAVVNGVKGAILSACLAFIYPASIHLKLTAAEGAKASARTRAMRAGSVFLICFGVVSGVLALLAMFVLPQTDFSAFVVEMQAPDQ